MQYKIGDQVEVTITSLAHGGAGVGRSNDFVFFVPYTSAGDRVRVQVVGVKKNYAEAELIELLEPGPHRVQPPCPVFGECGGCQWQHVKYEAQLQAKQAIVSHALARIAKEEGVTVNAIVPSPQEWHYRNRIQVRALEGQVGFYRRGSHQIVEFGECLIAEKALNAELGLIKEELKKASDNGVAKPSLPSAPTGRALETKIEVFLTAEGRVVRSYNRAHGEELGFSQVNSGQNSQLQGFVATLAGKSSGGSLLDLYCGNGNFSFPLEAAGWNVLGVDLSSRAISQAQKQAQLEKRKAAFFSEDGVRATQRFVKEKKSFDLVLLDPPRIGADEYLWKPLADLAPPKIIYVSCHPATFARDWARLKSSLLAKGLKPRLEIVQPFDMFPQTFHVELVAEISVRR